MFYILLVFAGIIIILAVLDFQYYKKYNLPYIKEKLLKRKIKKILLNNTLQNGMTLVLNGDLVTLIYKYPEVNKITLKKSVIDRMFPDIVEKFKKIAEYRKNTEKFRSKR